MDSFFKKENRFPCPPNVTDIRENVREYLDTYGEESVSKVNTTITCVEDYLNLYNMLVTGNPPEDSLVEEIYNKTIKMIDEAKKARRYQKDTIKRDLISHRNEFKDVCVDNIYEIDYSEELKEYCDELKNDIDDCEKLIKIFNSEISTLNNIKSICKNAKNKSDKIVCVEKFVSTSHARGPFIPLGCGGRLSESINEITDDNQKNVLLEKFTPDLEDEAQKVLDCLKEYKG